MPTGMRPLCRVPSVFKKNLSSTSPGIARAPSRRLAVTVVGLALFAVAAGTRAVIVSAGAPVNGRNSPTVAAPASFRQPASAELSLSATAATVSATGGATASGEPSSDLTVASSHARSARGLSLVPATSTQSTSASQIFETSDAAAATQSTAALSGAPPSPEAPFLSVPTAPSVGDPVGRGQPVHVAFDWRMLIGRPGITVTAAQITDASSGTSAMTGAHALRTHSNLELTLDLEKMIGVPGLTVYAQHKTRTGRNGSGEAAFVQNFSNIDAANFRALGQVFVEQRALQDRLRIKAGRLDFNAEFAGTDHGASFLNAAMGYSPSIVAAPTFPLPTSAVNVFVTPRKNFTLGVGVFNGLNGAAAPVGGSSRFQIAQANQRWSVGGSELSGRLGVGAWRHTGMFSSVDVATDAEPDLTGTRGWYATLDQTLWRRSAHAGVEAGVRPNVAMFAQFGRADSRVRAVNAHQGGGLTFAGVLRGRPADVVGVGVTRASLAAGRETINELFYQMPITAHLSFVGDMQHVTRRDATGDRQLGLVTTFRTIVSF